ncbi:MAG: RodZ domain-containing protein [Pseudomonadota bacterium]
MTSENTSTTDNKVDIGATLRAARESASYSVAFVADQIHLQENVINSIEANEFDQLPGPVFVRGYIRSYAKLLEIDPRPFIEQIEGKPENQEVDFIANKPIKVKSSRLDPIVIWGAATVFIIAIGLAITWWMQESMEDPVQLAEMVEQVDEVELTEEINIQAASQQEQIPVVEEHQVSLGEVSSENVSAVQDELAITSVISERTEEIIASDESGQDIIEIPAIGGDVNQTSLTVIFNEESWAEIFDARKRRLLHGLIKPGATRVISGKAPFSIFLGNSPGVEVEVNGKKYDHTRYIRGNNTARFQIDDQNT